MSESYNSAPNCNPEKRSKDFTSPTNDGNGSYGRTPAVKSGETPKSPLANLESLSKAESSNHKQG
jgi:hypothetical protein